MWSKWMHRKRRQTRWTIITRAAFMIKCADLKMSQFSEVTHSSVHKKTPLIPEWVLVESQGFCVFMSTLAGKLTDKTSLTAERAGGEKGAVLIACLCLTAATHSPWPKPNCNPMILICPITSFSCFLLTALCVCECVCVCVWKQRPRCHCAVWCSCVCFRCFYTKDKMIDEENEEGEEVGKDKDDEEK